MTVAVHRHQFTVHEYARIRDAGVLTEDDRVELLDGEIYTMSPIGPRHVGLVNKLNRLLGLQVGSAAIISIQNPVHLNDYNEPQPDIALLRPRGDFYTAALATPDDIVLIIEVADSSLEYDRDEKLPRYAQAGIGEVWIIDAATSVIEQYTLPLQGEYTNRQKILPGRRITATMMSDISIDTIELFS